MNHCFVVADDRHRVTHDSAQAHTNNAFVELADMPQQVVESCYGSQALAASQAFFTAVTIYLANKF